MLTVALGDSLILNCTYDCSGGFVRGCWSKSSDRSGCSGTVSKMALCTVSLHLPNVTTEDLEKNLTCYTQNTDDFQLRQNIQQTVLLQLHGEQTYPNTNIDILLQIFYSNDSIFNIKLCNFSVFPAQTTTPYPSSVTLETETNNGKVYLPYM